MFCSLIMAGGKGTRFWPASTEDKPKQFLKLIGEDSMLQMTVNRMRKLMPIEQIFIVTGNRYKELVSEQIADLPLQNIILEPTGRNTAPCVLLACNYIKQIYSNAIISVVASDAMISKEDIFCEIMKQAYTFLYNQKTGMITLGIEPDRAEIGYGYIECKDALFNEGDASIQTVLSFKEKPNLETAKEYLRSGKYLWNAGMFVFELDYFLAEAKLHMKESYQLLTALPSIDNPLYEEQLSICYKLCESISFDYAIAEKCASMYVIPSNIGWDDIGSWQSVERYLVSDESDNCMKGDFHTLNARHNVLFQIGEKQKKVVLMNVENLFYIETDEVIIVGPKDDIEKVSKVRKKYEAI